MDAIFEKTGMEEESRSCYCKAWEEGEPCNGRDWWEEDPDPENLFGSVWCPLLIMPIANRT